jgi:Ca2+-binding RTX toxin-like protein
VSSITGSANGDTLVGDSSSSIDGGAGNDAITGGANNDTLVGGDGADTITAGAGNDNINGGAGNDSIVMAANFTTGDVIDGGDGTDTLSITSATTTGSLNVINGLSFTAATALNNALSNVERVTITDALVIDAANFDMSRLDNINYVTFGGALGTAAETIIGVAANSTFVLTTATAGTGNETTLTLADATGTADVMNFVLTNNTDTTDFGNITTSGVETINITTAETTSAANTAGDLFVFDLTASGATSIVISGSESLDLSGVNQSAASIDASGLAGQLKITGAATGSSMTITGGSAADSITGGVAADSITGGAGADTLLGSAGDDTISGGAGADSITGGTGNDVISLGASDAASDTYVLSGAIGTSNIDSIADFNVGSTNGDVLDLTALAAVVGTTTEALVSITSTTTAGAAGDNILVLNTGAYYANAAAVLAALGSGGAITIGSGIAGADGDAILVYQASAGGALRVASVTVANAGGFSAATDLVVLTGVTTTTGLVAANFTTD